MAAGKWNPRNSKGDTAQEETIRRRAEKRAWYLINRTEILAYQREWRAANKDKQRANYHRRRASYRERELLRQYGIDLAGFEAMRAAQKGRCVICCEPFSKMPHVDHCHSTGRVRALLCADCNIGLGRFHDDPERMERAATYLRLHSEAKTTLARMA